MNAVLDLSEIPCIRNLPFVLSPLTTKFHRYYGFFLALSARISPLRWLYPPQVSLASLRHTGNCATVESEYTYNQRY